MLGCIIILILVILVCILIIIIILWRKPQPPPFVIDICPPYISLDESSTSVSIPSNLCNSASFSVFHIRALENLSYIEIGDDNYYYTTSFILENLPKLEKLVVGNNVSSQHSLSSHLFQITNCSCLVSIEIGERSFRGYGDVFDIHGCPLLKQIEFKGFNFQCSQFVLNGILCRRY